MNIKQCRSCHSNHLIDILSLGAQYLYDFVELNDPYPESFPLDLVMCKNCTLLQLKSTTPPEKLYTDRYGFKSGINNTIKADLEDIVSKACTYADLGVTVDIGCNDGYLLSCYTPRMYRIGYEPVTKYAKEAEGKANVIINDYFSAEKYPKGIKKAKIVTAISMFYDLDDPGKFVDDVAAILDTDGVFIVQQNYLLGMLKQNAYDNVVHEHLEYYSLTSLEHLLNRHYLKVVDVEVSDINGGSFRAYVKHMSELEKMREIEKHWKLDNKWTYVLWGMKINSLRKKLYNFVKKQVDDGKTVYCYAASTRGSTLLQSCGLDHTLIKAAVERNPEKWGKKMASTGIPIISEEEARKSPPDFGILLPWFFADEIVKREQELIKKGMKFIIPLPIFKVIGAEQL